MNNDKNVILTAMPSFVLLILIFILSIPVSGQFGNPMSGPVEPDIDAVIKYEEGLIVFNFDLEADHHITDLANGFFTINLDKNDSLEIVDRVFPKGVAYDKEMVFKGAFEVKVYVKSLKDITAPVKLTFKIGYQICQEHPQEVCFPPDETELNVTIDKPFIEAKPPSAAGTSADSSVDTAGTKTGSEAKASEDESFAQWVERTIKEELEKKSVLLFLLVFLAGFLTSLTPCVYPVIPIVMGYIGTRSGKKKLKGLYLSVFFVLGLSIVYSVFGVIAATTGTMMGVSFQNPIVVIVIAAIFIFMGLSLAGFFEIPVPSSISSKMQSGHKSEILGSLIVGGVSGIIAAPCVGPVLIALLSWISQTGNILLGFWLTFTFSMGMGVIFLLVGTFSGIVSAMPKGGKWMDYVKYFFALVLLGGGIYFLGNIASEWLNLLLWGVFLVAASIFMGLFKSQEEDAEHKSKLFKVVLVLLFLIGALLFVRGIDMKYFPAKYAPAASLEKGPSLPWIKDLDEGKKIAKAENKIMMIDTYADWCVACKELDEYTFSEAEVAERLKTMTLVKLDFTKKNEANDNLRKSLNVIGMPTVIFYRPDGTEIKRFSGFMKKDAFLNVLDSLK